MTKPGTSSTALVETVDIYPTLAALAGLPTPTGPQPIDGLSLVSILKQPNHRVRDHAYHAYPRRGNLLGRAVRTQRYRLVEGKRFGASTESAEYELYDYTDDPLETENLASRQPSIVAALKAMLARHPEPLPPHK